MLRSDATHRVSKHRPGAPAASGVVGRPVQTRGGEGEDFVPIRGHADRVLKLGRERAILGKHGPSIWCEAHRRAAEIHLYDKEAGPAGYFPVHIGNLD